MSDCFVLYLLLTCMKKKTSGADKFTNNKASGERVVYIVDSGQRELFDPEKYEITSIYDRFYVVKDRSKS